MDKNVSMTVSLVMETELLISEAAYLCAVYYLAKKFLQNQTTALSSYQDWSQTFI